MSEKQRVAIAGLKPNQPVELRVLLVGKELLPYTKGNQEHYRLKVDLMDRTGRISGNVWDNAGKFDEYLHEGRVVEVRAVATEWNGILGLNIQTIKMVPEGEDSPKNYLPVAQVDLARLYTEIKNWIMEIQHPGLRNLLHYVFLDLENSPYPRKFVDAIGAVTQHHAYIGGLLEHTHHVTYWARAYAAFYGFGQQIMDLVTAGALLHDIGKLDTYQYETGFDRTTDGHLLEHIATGIRTLNDIFVRDSLSDNPKFQLDPETKSRLEHMILSHHGKMEWGSPVVPQTPEAFFLHAADMVDSQFNKMVHLIAKTGDAEWTERTNLWGNNVRLYLGSSGGEKTQE